MRPRDLTITWAWVPALCFAFGASACAGATQQNARVQPRPAAPLPSGPVIRRGNAIARPYGHGAGQVWLITPRTAQARSVVVFIHGWTATSPFDWHEPWLQHLVARGSAVIFPAYQSGGEDSFVTTPYDLRDDLSLGFRALDRPRLPVVVAGYSVGGALAFAYAAHAAAWRLPRPVAI
jgi:pimeloyl-ACP methyl ester carboxylesterase